MKLPGIAIRNYHFTVVIFILLVLFGVTSFMAMPRTEDPPVTPPGSTITIIFPGAGPNDLESLVVDPIEEAINELEDIRTLSSQAGDGLAFVEVEFEAGTEADEKYDQVVQKVNGLGSELPEEIRSIDIFKWSTTDVAVLQLALVSESSSYAELEDRLVELKKKVERLPGVRDVETMAFPEQEVRVEADLEKMARMRIPLSRVVDAIQSNNTNIPGGTVDAGSRRFAVKTSGSYDSVEQIRRTIVQAPGGWPLYLEDIAGVGFDYQDETYRARFNAERAVFMTVSQKEDTNIFTVVGRVKPVLEEFARGLPPGMDLNVVFDQSESVEGRINRFFLNLLQGLVVVGLIVLIGVGIRAAAIVMTAIPVSFLIGLGFVHLTGYGLQQMSIVGLVIALGLLVDNAIVVTENVSRFIEQGVEPREAAARGAGQIGWAVVSATVTTVLAFIPIVLLRDMTGDFIRSMPVTVIYTLTASLLVALTLTPYLSSLLLRRSGKSRGFSRIVARDRGGRPERGGRPAPEGGRQPQPDAQRAWHRAGGAVQNTFGRMLGFALSHRILTVALTVAVFGAALGLFPLLGSSLFPKAEKPQFIINVEAPEGTSLDRTDQLTRLIEEDLLQREQIGHVAANIGKGNPRIYYNLFSLGEKPNQAQLFVQLKRYDYREMQELIADLRQTYAEFTGASVEVKELLQGPPVEAPIAIKILGENLDVLQELARDVEALVGSVPGTVNVDNPLRTGRTDLLVSINREKAGILNVPVAEIDRTVRAGITGLEVSRYRDPAGEEFDIVIRLPIDGKASISDFDRIYVSAYGSAAPAIIPLGQLARLEFEQSPVSINHYNLERAATITADVVGDQSVDQATREVLQKLDQYSWPRGYRYEVAGEFESREESFGGLRQAFLIALAAIFAVLVLQFRSYTQPLIVFSAIPLAIIGSVAALFITGNDFSFSAFVGLTGLIGIVVNNSILLVEYANHLREEGAGLSEAVREAARVRFKPIMLTTCTTVGGLLPLTLQGGTLWAPFGWTIIGGLATSTVLTLVVVPVFYTFFTPGEMKAGPYPS